MTHRLGWLPVLIAAAAAGCSTVQPHLAPAPAVYKDPRIALERNIPPDLRTPELPVFFATTRAATHDEEHFGGADGNGVTLGVARARLGEPGWTFEQLVESNRASNVATPRNGAVESVRILGRAGQFEALSDADRAFVTAIDDQILRTGNRELLVYVHGYRVTFDEVTVQMASFGHYLGGQATVTFQWPTGLMFYNYVTDCPRAERYIPDIERLLALLAHSRADNINVMAYSCGSPLLASALARLRKRHAALDHAALRQRLRIGNVIFVASDVDFRTFARDYVEPALDLAQQVVVYYSQADRALRFSALMSGGSRLGQPRLADLEELTVADLDRLSVQPRFHAVDVTDVSGAHEMGGMKGHGYWYANDIISTDVMLSLRYPIPPERRCLANVPGTRIWRIPPGYVDCVAGRLVADYPALRR